MVRLNQQTAFRMPAWADVTLRTAIAVVLGFVCASAAVLAASALLIATGLAGRGGAVHGATITTWLIWSGIAMLAFHTPRPGRLALWLGAITAGCGWVAVSLGWGAGG
jgi:hypothetical protein